MGNMIHKLIMWVRFGTVTIEVMSIDGGRASEIAYKDRWGRVVGYWAYGYFDPYLPYKGDK